MATIIGSLRPAATAGEKEVFNRLKELPETYIVWPELAVYDRYPDFVIFVPGRGVAILEVKDWVEVVEANPQTFTVRTRGGDERNEPNPVPAVREKAHAIQNKLATEPELLHARGPHAGRLRLPYAYAVVLPRLTDMFIYALGPIFDEPRCVISRDKLNQTPPETLLGDLNWMFRPDLSPRDVDLIRGALYPELKVLAAGQAGDQVLGVMDQTQEQAAKEGLYETPAAEAEELPEDGRRLAVNPVIRLVRGAAGSGKTLVLARRAAYLAELHRERRVLVVTFNKALAYSLQQQLAGHSEQITVTNFHQLARELIDEMGDWGSGPVGDARGAIARLLPDMPPNERLDAAFLAHEIRWMKESGLTDLNDYLAAARTGRGRPLPAADRQWVHDVYQRYQHHLNWRRRFDWEDVPQMVINAIDAGMLEGARYDAILVDEAQDFAPSWFGVLRRLLNPETAIMFMAADGVQRIYRQHSWRSLGLHVVGRTRVLPRPYRMTYEIARAAAELVRGNTALVDVLRGDGEELPHTRLDAGWMRHGDPPELRFFPDQLKEKKWVCARVKALLSRGYAPGEIAVFHRKQRGVDEYAGYLMENRLPVRVLKAEARMEDEGVAVGTMHSAKGLEFRVVFAPQLQMMFGDGGGASAEEQRARTIEEIRLLYVAMTRARERVYLLHQGRLPEQLAHLEAYLKGVML